MNTPFYYFPLGSPIGICISFLLALFYGSLMLIRVVIELYHGTLFQHKQRTNKDDRPKILDKYGTHHHIQLKNVKLHYVSAGDHSKQLMLFVHGFPENWYSWRYQMEEFSKDYHTVAVNLRGYGESDKPSAVSQYTTDKLVKDVAELIQALSDTKKQTKCILVAHDWGGIVGWTVAQHFPSLVDRFVVLNAPHPQAFRARLAQDWRQFFSSWYMFYFQLPLLPELMIKSNDYNMFDKLFGQYSQDKQDVEVYKYYLSQSANAISGPLNYYRATIRNLKGSQPEAKSKTNKNKVQPPSIIIWGKNDSALVSELATDSAKHCSNVKVQYLDQCSHWIQIHKPKEVNEIIRNFLK